MTLAIALANSEMSIPAQQTPSANALERQAYDFATLLAALVRSSTTTQHDSLALPQDEHRASSSVATRGEVLHEFRAAEFLETGVFGLMDVGVPIEATDAMAARTQQIGTDSEACVQRPPQQSPARDVLTWRSALEPVSNFAIATSGASPQHRLQPRPPAHALLRPPDVVDEAAPATVRVQRQAESRSPARIEFHSTTKHALLLASGQTTDVRIAITAAEHGLSVFARVGRMEPTERARLRHAAALLLAQHGHHGATVTLDTDVADAKGE